MKRQEVVSRRGKSDRLGTDPLDYVRRRQQDRPPAQILDECLRKHEALVGLHCQVDERQYGRTVVSHGKRAQVQHGLQLEQMFAARLGSSRVFFPERRINIELPGNTRQQRRWRLDASAEGDARVAHAGKLDRKSQAVGCATVLVNQRQLRFAERVVTDEVIAAIRKRKETARSAG